MGVINMIDIHCHILPGIDDGPKTLDESLKMARKAVSEGIKTIIATPHNRNNQFNNLKEQIIKHVDILNDILLKEDIPLTILPGQENRIYGELLEDYKTNEIQTIANSEHLFIEFPSSTVPRYAERLLYNLQIQGLTPIIVHPERNKEIIENPKIIYSLVKNGALTQITAGSIAGYFGKGIKKFSRQLIEHNLTHFVASDAHNIQNRSFNMVEAFECIEKEFGLTWSDYFIENSELLVKNKPIVIYPPNLIRKKKFLSIFSI